MRNIKTSNFKITSHTDHSTLFEGDYTSIQECLEHAVAQNIALSHADLRNLNLSNANLDDAQLSGADFTGSNLSGANLSESTLDHCNFSNTSLINSCLAYSDLHHCQFEGAEFGACNIVGANLSYGRFSGLSCFSLNFIEAECVEGCHYQDMNGVHYAMSKTPVVIMGLNTAPMVFLDDYIQIGDSTEKR